MRLFRRNALGVYAVYGAAIVSGLVVTPIILDSIGDDSFGIWAFIGAITIYLSVLDFGVGPTVVRYAAEARGRRSVEDTNAIASVGLALYGVIGLVTLPVGLALAWFVPALVETPDDLVWEARIASFLVVLSIAARFPLGLFNNLLVGQQRFDLQNLANFVSSVLYAVLVALLLPNGGGLVLLAALTLGITVLRLVLPLAWLRRELPGLRLSRAFVTRARVRELTAFSWTNFLVHVANKVVFATDVVVVGIVLGARAAALYAIPAKLFTLAFGLGSVGTTLLYPAFAEHEGAREEERQRRLLLAGLRGGTAATLLLALPLLLVPDQVILGWVGAGYGESSPVLALLALVLLVHQPIYLVTQFLIARGRQRAIARALVIAGVANVRLLRRAGVDGGNLGRRAEHAGDRSRRAGLRRRGAARACRLARGRGRSRGRSCAPSFRPRLPRCSSSSASRATQSPTPGSSCCRSGSPGCSSAVSRSGDSGSTRTSGRASAGSFAPARPRRARARTGLAARQVEVEQLLVAPCQHVPVQLRAGLSRRGREPRAGTLVLAEVDDRVDELARRRHEHARAGLAQVLRHLVVVRDGGHSEADELAHLGRLDARVLRPRVEREVEVGRGRERLLTRQTAEENDVVTARDALLDPVARAADEPEPRPGEARVDLVPELEQVLDVVERAVAAAILAAEQEGGHPADDELAGPAARRSLGDEVVAERAEADPLRDDVVRSLDAELVEAAAGAVRRDDERLEARAAASASTSRGVNAGSSTSETTGPPK